MQLNVFLFPSCYPIIWLVTIVEWEWFRSLWHVFITVWVPIVEIYPSFHWGSEGQEVSRISPIATQTAINKEIRSIYCTHGGHLELQSLFPEMNALGHYYDSPKWLKGNPYWEKYVGCHCWLSSENARLLAGSGFHAFYITACSFRTARQLVYSEGDVSSHSLCILPVQVSYNKQFRDFTRCPHYPHSKQTLTYIYTAHEKNGTSDWLLLATCMYTCSREHGPYTWDVS